jgi:formylglycine-generating enzyme required for sulfatase activity
VYTEWPFVEAEAERRQKATAEALGVDIEQDIDLGGGLKMTFVLIPAGEFLMGSPPTTSPEKLAAAYGGEPKYYESEFPQHRVKISRPFWIGKYEVTQEQWMAVFPTNPSANKDKPKNPVEMVDWNQAHGLAKALGEKLGKTFRLPTEAEWEYACRAGTATEFYFGNDAAKIPDFGWVGGSTQPVGMKKPNAWGLFDMAGNVWEWCEDWHGKYEGGAQTDPKGSPGGGPRVLRGGSWGDGPGGRRSAYRSADVPGYRLHYLGFRVVLVPGPKEPAEDVKPGQWQSLFDGKTLDGWRVVKGANFGETPQVTPRGGLLVFERGGPDIAVSWTRPFPTTGYELSLECRLDVIGEGWCVIFPVGDSHCRLVVGGWRGSVAGLDLLDGREARDNDTTKRVQSVAGRWSTAVLRVTEKRVQASLDGRVIVDQTREGHTFGLDRYSDAVKPFGLYVIRTTASMRNIRLRHIERGAGQQEGQAAKTTEAADGLGQEETAPAKQKGYPSLEELRRRIVIRYAGQHKTRVPASPDANGVFRLTRKESPYFVNWRWVIMEDRKLVIEPGVVVLAGDKGTIEVNGEMTCEGTQDEPIAFLGMTQKPGSWAGISLVKRHERSLKWTLVAHAKDAFTVNGTARFESCLITNNTNGFRLISAGLQVRDCAFVSNAEVGIIAGEDNAAPYRNVTIACNGGIGYLGTFKGWGVLSRCIIAFNLGGGIKCSRGGGTYRGAPRAEECVIAYNGSFDAWCDQGESWVFRRNYWGKGPTAVMLKEGPEANLQNIIDGRDKPGVGIVDFSDPAPDPQAEAGAPAAVLAIRPVSH